MSLEKLKICSLHGDVHRHATPHRRRDHDHDDHDGQEEKRVVPRGLEPRTLRLLAVRSNQLSYETHVVCRAGQCSRLPEGRVAGRA